MSFLPESVKEIYPNPVQQIDGTPVVIFRDHRWTLPVLSAGAGHGLLPLPATVVTFDRHRDLLAPLNGTSPLKRFREGGAGFPDLVDLVRDHCSSRDDDWICAGMELGIIGDVVQFSASESYENDPPAVIPYTDASGVAHRVFQLGRPAKELSYKGSLVEGDDGVITGALRSLLEWDPSAPGIVGEGNSYILDIDLDFFTMDWQNYTLPFPREVFNGEFLSPCQSDFYDAYTPRSFFHGLLGHASLISIACEPGFCGGAEKTRDILESVNRVLCGSRLDTNAVMVDYPVSYPDE